MATAVESIVNIAKGGKFSRWVEAVDASSRGIDVVCYSCLIKAAAGEISLSSKFGQWCWRLSAVLDSRDNEIPLDASTLGAYLRAAGGEVPLSSSFGQWAQRMNAHAAGDSRLIDG